MLYYVSIPLSAIPSMKSNCTSAIQLKKSVRNKWYLVNFFVFFPAILVIVVSYFTKFKVFQISKPIACNTYTRQSHPTPVIVIYITTMLFRFVIMLS